MSHRPDVGNDLPIFIRAGPTCYLPFTRACSRSLAFSRSRSRSLSLSPALSRSRSLALSLSRSRSLYLSLSLSRSLNFAEGAALSLYLSSHSMLISKQTHAQICGLCDVVMTHALLKWRPCPRSEAARRRKGAVSRDDIAASKRDSTAHDHRLSKRGRDCPAKDRVQV